MFHMAWIGTEIIETKETARVSEPFLFCKLSESQARRLLDIITILLIVDYPSS